MAPIRPRMIFYLARLETLGFPIPDQTLVLLSSLCQGSQNRKQNSVQRLKAYNMLFLCLYDLVISLLLSSLAQIKLKLLAESLMKIHIGIRSYISSLLLGGHR